MSSTILIAVGTVVLFLVSGGIYSVVEFDGVWILPVGFFWLGVIDSFIRVPYYDAIIMGVLAIPVLVVVGSVGLFIIAGNESQSSDSQSDAIDMDGVSKYFQSDQETNSRESTSTGRNNTDLNNSESDKPNVSVTSDSNDTKSDSEDSDTAIYEPEEETSDTKIYRE